MFPSGLLSAEKWELSTHTCPIVPDSNFCAILVMPLRLPERLYSSTFAGRHRRTKPATHGNPSDRQALPANASTDGHCFSSGVGDRRGTDGLNGFSSTGFKRRSCRRQTLRKFSVLRCKVIPSTRAAPRIAHSGSPKRFCPRSLGGSHAPIPAFSARCNGGVTSHTSRRVKGECRIHLEELNRFWRAWPGVRDLAVLKCNTSGLTERPQQAQSKSRYPVVTL